MPLTVSNITSKRIKEEICDLAEIQLKKSTLNTTLSGREEESSHDSHNLMENHLLTSTSIDVRLKDGQCLDEEAARVKVASSSRSGRCFPFDEENGDEENQFQTKSKKTKYFVFAIFGFLLLCWILVIYLIIASASKAAPSQVDPHTLFFPSDHAERPPLSYAKDRDMPFHLLLPHQAKENIHHQHTGSRYRFANEPIHSPKQAILKTPDEKVWIKWLSEKDQTLEHWHAAFTFNAHGSPMDDLTVKIELFNDEKCTQRASYNLLGGDRVYTNGRGVARFDNLRGTIMGSYWGRATVILTEDESRTEETSCIKISGPDDCKFFDRFWRLYQAQSSQFFQSFSNYTLWRNPK